MFFGDYKTYGSKGSNLYLANMTGNIKDCTLAFNTFYNAGKNGKDLYSLYNTYNMDTETAQEIYFAGVQDNTKAKKVGGLIRNENRHSINEREARALDIWGKAFGVTISLDSAIEKDANGEYGDGIVHVSTNSDKPTLAVFSHEFTHRLEETSPTAYKEYEDYLWNQGNPGGILVGLLLNTGNFHQRRKDALREAQRNPNVKDVIERLQKVKSLKSNEPRLTPDPDFVIYKNTKAILVKGKKRK